MTENHRSKSLPEAQDVVGVVDELLQRAVASGASDVHFEPTGADLKVKYRLDGALSPVESLPAAVADNVVARLKVLGGLLTYRNDIPQEGRLELNGEASGKVTDVRLAVFPTIYGQRAVVRLEGKGVSPRIAARHPHCLIPRTAPSPLGAFLSRRSYRDDRQSQRQSTGNVQTVIQAGDLVRRARTFALPIPARQMG